MAKCLYCDLDADTHEHVIPAAFGEFKDAPRLQTPVCTVCNSQRLGLLDEQVARCGPEGFMREFYGVTGRAHHTKVNPFARGSAGGKRLEFSTFDREVGVEVNLEIRNGVVTQMCELIFVETETGKIHHIPLKETMTADELRTEIQRRAVAKPFETRLSCYPHEQAWVEKLLQEHSPGMTISEPKLMSHVIEKPTVKFQVGERYYRGIAKIGFHYFLTQFPAYSGHEPMFSRIRSFICEDTKEPIRRINEIMSMRQHPLLREMLEPGVRPDGWKAHFLAAEVAGGVCLAHVHMFLTEDSPGQIYTINLGSDPANQEPKGYAHKYRYYSDGKHGQFLGEAVALTAIRLTGAVPPARPVIETE
jgi:hypothetical protein